MQPPHHPSIRIRSLRSRQPPDSFLPIRLSQLRPLNEGFPNRQVTGDEANVRLGSIIPAVKITVQRY